MGRRAHQHGVQLLDISYRCIYSVQNCFLYRLLGFQVHYEEHWGLKLPPFENVPDPKFYYPSPKHEEGLHRLLYGIEARKGAVMLTGDIGCGKTMLSRALVRQLPIERYETALIANPSLFEPQDFFRELLYQFGIEASGSKLDLVRGLNDSLLDNLKRGKDAVLIIDEAQSIKSDTVFEELRLLLNFQLNDRFLLTLVFLGQPEMNERINALPQFAQRIAVRFHLSSFDLEETAHYMDFRLAVAGATGRQLFSKEAIEVIFLTTGGVPRNINKLADLCLLSGFLERKNQVDDDLVNRVAEDFRV